MYTWAEREGVSALAWLPLPVLGLAWDHHGELWILDAAHLRSRARTWPAPLGTLTVDRHGVGVAEAHWEDGVGPVCWIHRPDGAIDVRPGAAPPAEPFVGTPDGRYLVARRDGLRAIWELPR